MNPLQKVLITTIRKEPSTGYELTAKLNALGWSVSHQQVYRDLVKLHNEGTLMCCEEPQNGKPDKKVYSLFEDILPDPKPIPIPEFVRSDGVAEVLSGCSTEKLEQYLVDLRLALKQVEDKLMEQDTLEFSPCDVRKEWLLEAEINWLGEVIENRDQITICKVDGVLGPNAICGKIKIGRESKCSSNKPCSHKEYK